MKLLFESDRFWAEMTFRLLAEPAVSREFELDGYSEGMAAHLRRSMDAARRQIAAGELSDKERALLEHYQWAREITRKERSK